MNKRKIGLWCSAIIGATGTLFWVFGILLDGIINIDGHPFLLLIAVLSGTFIVALLISKVNSNMLDVPETIPIHVLIFRFIISAAVSYPLLAIFYGIASWAFIAVLGSGPDALEAIILIALWLPLWTLPLSGAFLSWRWSARGLKSGDHNK